MLQLAAMAQADTVLLKSFGGAFFEEASEVIQREGGGYTIVGTTGSNESGSTDVFVASFDEELNCQWSRNYGNADADWGLSIVEDFSGNFLVTGYTLGDNTTSYDMMAMKLDAQGELMWRHTYGGSDWDFAHKIMAHPLGGFLICGRTYSNGNGDQDGTVLHIDGQGILLSQWFMGGTAKDAAADILRLDDGWAVGGYQTIDDKSVATIWKFDTMGNPQWERMLNDTNGFNRELTALTSANGYVYATGQVYSDAGTKSFEYRIPLDNSTEFEVVETQTFEFIYRDCVALNDKIVFVGSKIDNAIEVGRVVRKHSDLYFTGVFEFTGQYRAKFNSVIWNEDALVMCGSFQPTASGNPQAVLLKYTSSIMNEVNSEPETAPCFSVGIDELTMPVAGDKGLLYSSTGQLVCDNYEWNTRSSDHSIASGVYFFLGKGRRAYVVYID
jgi:hypothetical protein